MDEGLHALLGHGPDDPADLGICVFREAGVHFGHSRKQSLLVSGQGIPANTTITSITSNSGTSITLTAPSGMSFATLAGNLSLTIWQPSESEVLITGSGSSEVAGGNGTETIIGGSVLRTGSDTNPGGSTTNVGNSTQDVRLRPQN